MRKYAAKAKSVAVIVGLLCAWYCSNILYNIYNKQVWEKYEYTVGIVGLLCAWYCSNILYNILYNRCE